MLYNLFSVTMFALAVAGWIVAHHDLIVKFPFFRSRLFLMVLGPVAIFAGVVAVLATMAENGNDGLPRLTFYANVIFGIMGVYMLCARPFKNGFKNRGTLVFRTRL